MVRVSSKKPRYCFAFASAAAAIVGAVSSQRRYRSLFSALSAPISSSFRVPKLMRWHGQWAKAYRCIPTENRPLRFRTPSRPGSSNCLSEIYTLYSRASRTRNVSVAASALFCQSRTIGFRTTALHCSNMVRIGTRFGSQALCGVSVFATPEMTQSLLKFSIVGLITLQG